MKSLIVIVAGLLVISSCAGEAEKIHLRTEKGEQVETAKVTANAMLTVEIKGMMCEMGCGGSIRKELKSTGAVARVQYDFEEDRALNTAMISFDSTQISAAEMLKRIQKMNEKQFTIGKQKVEALTESKSDSKAVGSNDEASVNMEETTFRIPNLLNILKDLVVH
jgi:copper chaperone CopZ